MKTALWKNLTRKRRKRWYGNLRWTLEWGEGKGHFFFKDERQLVMFSGPRKYTINL